MEAYEAFASLAVAFAVGILIGLEREQSSPASTEDRRFFFGGSRTFPLFAATGAVSMLLTRTLGVWALVAPLLGIVALLAAVHAASVSSGKDVGLTSELAAIVTFLLGALATSHGVIEPFAPRLLTVSAVAVVTAFLLSLKPVLHSFVRKASKDDVYATLKFLLVFVVVLPLLPDRAFGPFDALNPRKVGWMVALIAGVSFVGYVAIRVLGPRRGLGLTGLVGGLVSSTAVTLSMSSRARRERALALPCAIAVLLASGVMYLRVLLVIAVVNRPLMAALAPSFAAAALLCGLVAAALYRRQQAHDSTPAEVKFSNPFELSEALQFGLLFTAVLLASKAAHQYFGTSGSYLTGLVAGAADVDAVALSMAQLAKAEVSERVAATTIWIAAASNSLTKGAIAVAVGGWAFGRLVAMGFALALAGGAALFVLG